MKDGIDNSILVQSFTIMSYDRLVYYLVFRIMVEVIELISYMTTSVSRRFNIHDDSVLYNNAARNVIYEGVYFTHTCKDLARSHHFTS